MLTFKMTGDIQSII